MAANFEQYQWNIRYNNNIVRAIGYEKRGCFGVPVAEKRNGFYISAAIIALEKGYLKITPNTYYSLRRINAEERKILDKLGYTITPEEFITLK